MHLLWKFGCLLFGHAPVVERRGNDSILACARCRRPLGEFVKNLYSAEYQSNLLVRRLKAERGG